MNQTNFKKAREKLNENLVALKITTKIIPENLQLPEWAYLQHFYDNAEDKLDLIGASIMNSIVSQRRAYFALGRELTRALIQEDENILEDVGISNKKSWGYYIKFLISSGLMELVKEGSGNRPSVYKLTDDKLLKWLNIDEEKQKQEAIDFVTRNPNKSLEDSCEEAKETWKNLGKGLGVK